MGFYLYKLLWTCGGDESVAFGVVPGTGYVDAVSMLSASYGVDNIISLTIEELGEEGCFEISEEHYNEIRKELI